MTVNFLNGFKIFNIDQLILVVIFIFENIWSKKRDVKLSHAFIRSKDASKAIISFLKGMDGTMTKVTTETTLTTVTTGTTITIEQ